MNEDGIDRSLLLRIFTDEAEEHLAAMEQALVALEATPGDEDVLHTIFRGVHTIKGNAAMFGFEPIVEIAHLAEDSLDGVRAGRVAVTADLITMMLSAVDALKGMVHAAAADPETLPAADPALLRALRGAAGGGGAAIAPPIAVPLLGDKRNDTLRVRLRKLDTMMNVAGEIAIARGRLREIIDRMPDPSRELTETQELLDRQCNELQEHVTDLRMVPIGPVFQQQVRTARDVARGLGKVVQVRFEGEDVELDTAVIDQIRDPLVHMVRNAVDHGIEDPEQRVAQGKPRAGTILLRAYREGGLVMIQLIDDGAGLDSGKIAARAREAGLVGDEELSKEQIESLVFTPGFSTASSVTEMSGRGVGMDVVRRNITSLRGTVAIDSQPGRGTTVTIRLPLTLAIIDALAVGVGEETFVVPLDPVIECLDIDDSALQAGPSGVIDVRGQAVPYLRLSSCLGIAGRAASRRNLLLVRDGDRRVGIVVDRLHNRTQAVLKPLWKPMPRLQAIAGATILGNGSVALIVDLPRLLREQLREAL